MRWSLAFLIASLIPARCADASSVVSPSGSYIPKETLSPDGRYGVTVYDRSLSNQCHNDIIDIKSGRILGTIEGDPIAGIPTDPPPPHEGHYEMTPVSWSADGAWLLWRVDSKWGVSTAVLVHLQSGTIGSQQNVLGLLQDAILKRLKAAEPLRYAKIEQDHQAWGSWYRDGFAIDFVLRHEGAPLTFPMAFDVALTSDTKGIDPKSVLSAGMSAFFKKDGTLEVKDFHVGSTAARNW